MSIKKILIKMYFKRRRRKIKRKQKGGFFMLPFMYGIKAMNKIHGKGIQRPYINKRNRLMLGKGKKQKGGFFGWKEIWS